MSSSWKIPLHRPEIAGNEFLYLEDALTKGEWAWGTYVDRAEDLLREITGAKDVVCVDSGTTALELAIRHGMAAKPGDGIMIPDLTFPATGMAVLRAGCVPMIVDTDREGMIHLIDSWKIISGAEVTIASNRKVAGVIPVDLLGRAFDSEYTQALGAVVYDAAESLGSFHGARGTSCLSFNGNKVATGGGGGAIATDDQKLADLLRHARNQGQVEGGDFVHVGGNHRMSNLHAAVLTAQLEVFPETLAKKEALADQYDDLFAGTLGVASSMAPELGGWNGWLFSIKVPRGRAPRILKALEAQRIEARRMFAPLHGMPVFLKAGAYVKGPYPNSQELYETVVLLPSGIGVSLEDQELIAGIVKSVMQEPMEEWESKPGIPV